MSERKTKCDKCGVCRFWRSENKELSGRCLFDPPTRLLQSEATILCKAGTGIWPITAEYDWCGEFQLHDTESEVEEAGPKKETKTEEVKEEHNVKFHVRNLVTSFLGNRLQLARERLLKNSLEQQDIQILDAVLSAFINQKKSPTTSEHLANGRQLWEHFPQPNEPDQWHLVRFDSDGKVETLAVVQQQGKDNHWSMDIVSTDLRTDGEFATLDKAMIEAEERTDA